MGPRKLLHLGYNLMDVKSSRAFGYVPRSMPFLFIWVTGRCNMSCMMCDHWKGAREDAADGLSRQDIFSALDSASHLDTKIVTLTGGEPFIRDDIYDIIGRINDLGMSSHICSNGTMIDERAVKRLARSPPHTISISLDSHEEKKHDWIRGRPAYRKAVDAIRLIKRHLPRTRVGINHLLCRETYKDVLGMLEFSQKLGADQLNLQPIHTNLQHRNKPSGSFGGLLFEKDDLPHLEQKIWEFQKAAKRAGANVLSDAFMKGVLDLYNEEHHPKNYCYAGYVSSGIDARGMVSPCDNMDGTENIRDKSLEEIWRSDAFARLRNRVHGCRENCWDSAHQEINIRCSFRNAFGMLPNIFKEMEYYLER